MLIKLIDEAVKAGAKRNKACDIVGINIRTLQRWKVHARRDGAQEGCHSTGNSGIPPSKATLAA